MSFCMKLYVILTLGCLVSLGGLMGWSIAQINTLNSLSVNNVYLTAITGARGTSHIYAKMGNYLPSSLTGWTKVITGTGFNSVTVNNCVIVTETAGYDSFIVDCAGNCYASNGGVFGTNGIAASNLLCSSTNYWQIYSSNFNLPSSVIALTR